MSITPGLITGILSFLFTLALLSYLIGDNAFYRLALHVFIGVSVGYVALVVVYQVLIPRLVDPLTSGNVALTIIAGIPLILLIFLIMKISPRTAGLGNITMAFLVGVGTAVAVGGAVTGTLVPQIQATWLSFIPRGGANAFTALNNLIIVVGTISTLIYFQFWLRGQTASGTPGRLPIIQRLGDVGQGFIVVTLGVIYGGMILSGLAVFSGHVYSLVQWASNLMIGS